MKEKTLFLDMFSDYVPPEPLQSVLSQAAICAADLNPADRIVELCLECPEYIPHRDLDQICLDVEDLYGLTLLDITMSYPPEQLQRMNCEDIRDMFVRKNSMARASLAGATWTWEENTLKIGLRANGKKALDEAAILVRRELEQMFHTRVEIQIEAGQDLQGDELHRMIESMRQEFMTQNPAPVSRPSTPSQVMAAPSDMIFGKPFKGRTTPMSQLQLDMGGVIVEGRVFAVDHKELKKRNAWILSYDVTDNTGSVRVKGFVENNKAKPLLEKVKEGSVIRVRGDLMMDRYDNELILKPYAVMNATMPKREDTAVGQKRVELHLHTNMSSMDGLTDTQKAVRQAAAWGHRAVAITDHGCCHSFPDAMHAVEGKDMAKIAGTDEPIKVLYGCEGYFVNDVEGREIVCGQLDMPFDGEYVAFDLETTGLHPDRDRIIAGCGAQALGMWAQ